jgi:hypothetical protein
MISVSCHYVTSLEYNVLSTANTYDWMIATADFKTNRRICAVIKIHIRDCLIVSPLFPSSFNKRYPAIIFAVNRTARVPGRIIFLTVSIHTMNSISAAGFPCGTRCSNI